MLGSVLLFQKLRSHKIVHASVLYLEFEFILLTSCFGKNWLKLNQSLLLLGDFDELTAREDPLGSWNCSQGGMIWSAASCWKT